MAPLTESDLIFSSASTALRDTLGELRRNNLSVKNRLNSIYLDAQYVQNVAQTFCLPLVANERCGSWYIPPKDTETNTNGKRGSVYFKSTDGHFGQWSFSLRRLNLHILDLIGDEGGCIIVDSTRRGKSMPDALSKTIPIWVTVLNRLLFPEAPQSHVLQTPKDVVSGSEHAQIEAKVETFVTQMRGLQLQINDMRSKLRQRWMRIVWQRPGDSILGTPKPGPTGSNTVVLCTASNRVSTESYANSEYVQGAADDHESWALGLDASTFWSHLDQLLTATNDELPSLIDSLCVDGLNQSSSSGSPVSIRPGGFIWIASNAAAREHMAEFDFIISCAAEPDPDINAQLGKRYIVLPCPEGKVGSRHLRTELDKILPVGSMMHDFDRSKKPHLLVTNEGSNDLAVGVALAFICCFCTEDGAFNPEIRSAGPPINKTIIKQRLSWIMISAPYAKPSRATLQSVNAFLMG